MKTQTCLAFAVLGLVLSTAVEAGMIVIYPDAANHRHTLTTGKVQSTLTPDPVFNAGEFFLLDNVSATVKTELAGGDVAFPGWTFDYASKWKGVTGSLTVDRYTAEKPYPAFAGAALDARYQRASTDPTRLRWIQFVQTVPPFAFDPDQTFDTLTGAALGNGALPACVGAFIDPCGNDGTDGGPFYWNSAEIANETSGTNAFGAFDLHFSDFPRVTVSNTYPKNGLSFQLYLVEWDGAKNVSFLDGIRWGFIGVPEPSVLLVTLLGLALAALWCRPRGLTTAGASGAVLLRD